MNGHLKLCCYALFLTFAVGACATPSPQYKNHSEELVVRLTDSEAALFSPVEFQDIVQTFNLAEGQLANENIETADLYYQLVIGKVELLEKHFAEEVKRREDVARLEREKRELEAAEELRRKQELERERAEEAAKAAARLRQIEAEKAEARRRERARTEKEIPLAASHTVKRGETLPQIAALAEVYGDSSLWPLLYRANRDQVSNPAVLWPGQVLRIPRNHDRSELNEARRFSTSRPKR